MNDSNSVLERRSASVPGRRHVSGFTIEERPELYPLGVEKRSACRGRLPEGRCSLQGPGVEDVTGGGKKERHGRFREIGRMS